MTMKSHMIYPITLIYLALCRLYVCSLHLCRVLLVLMVLPTHTHTAAKKKTCLSDVNRGTRQYRMTKTQPVNLFKGSSSICKAASSALGGHAALYHMVGANVSRSYCTLPGKAAASCPLLAFTQGWLCCPPASRASAPRDSTWASTQHRPSAVLQWAGWHKRRWHCLHVHIPVGTHRVVRACEYLCWTTGALENVQSHTCATTLSEFMSCKWNWINMKLHSWSFPYSLVPLLLVVF